MVNRRLQTVLCGIAISTAAVAVSEAADDEIPDREFLEYLGMWDESDEEWLPLEEGEVADNEERSDPVPEGEELPETEDES